MEPDTQSFTLRDFVAVGFRHRRLIVCTFLGVLSIAVLFSLLLSRKYVAEMKILVRHQRAEPAVSPERDTPVKWQSEVSEEELQSEAELIKSRDLLGKVIVACGLQSLGGSPFWNKAADTEDQKVARAVLKLENDLTVEPIKLTNLISVSYRSKDPQMAAKVLNVLAGLYLEKHLSMHRAPGEFEFFHQQAEQYRAALADAERKLTNFAKDQGVINPTLEKEISVRQLGDLEAEWKRDRATVAETRQRIRALHSQLATVPQRETKEVRTSDNPQLMQTLKAKLLDLELKHTELLTRFEPAYRPVQEIEKQIAQTQSAIEAAENAPLREETTDRDPTYEALRTELAKAKTELAATKAGATATSSLINSYRAESEELERKELLRQDMLRAAKADEDNYLLYLHKQEEARISDALDRQRFSNVVVAEPATVPFQPQTPRLLVTVLGALFAALLSVMLAFLVDHWDESFRTPDEVEGLLGGPVVAAFPKIGQ
jgi:uncharacterized protein involved in exopolysaccharide biosynthesis